MSAIRFSHLSRIPGSYDMFKDIFNQMNAEIEECVHTGDFSKIHNPFKYLTQLSPRGLTRYVNEGSYYSALSPAMQKGEFQKVLDALDALRAYPQFDTPKITLCRAACLLQLDKYKKSTEEISDCRKINALIEEMIISSKRYEQQAYEHLRSFIEQPHHSNI